MAKMNMVQAINSALLQEMQRDEKVIILGEDVGKNGGVFRVTDGLYEKFGENRVIDTPLSESGIIGTSIGLSLNGFKPVPEIQFMGFVYPAFNQIISHVSRFRNRTRGRLTCPMVIRMPYGGGIHAPEHHSESTEALFAQIPGLKVVIPSTPIKAKALLHSAIVDNNPVIFLEPKKLYRSIKEDVSEYVEPVEIGKASIEREGKDLTLISWGAMMQPTLKAAEKLSEEEKSVEVIDLQTISPIDSESIINSVKKTGRLVIVHEAPLTCGVGSEISAIIAEKDILSLEAPIKRVTGFDTIFPLSKLENYYLPSVERILKSCREVLNF